METRSARQRRENTEKIERAEKGVLIGEIVFI